MVEIHCAELNQEMQNNVSGYIISYANTIMPKPEYEHASVKPLIANNTPLNYHSFDGNGIDLNENRKTFYTYDDYAGFISDDVSDEYCNVVASGYVHLEYSDGFLNFDQGVTIAFYGNCCSEIDVQYVYPDTTSSFETFTVNGDLFHFVPDPAYSESACSINIYFTKTKLPNQFIKVSYIKFGKITVLNKIKDISLLEEINVLSDDLPINSLDFSAIIPQGLDLQDNALFNVYSNNKYYGTFYFDDTERVSKNIYKIKALNCIKKLDDNQYKDWFFNGGITNFLSQIGRLSGIRFLNPNDSYSVFGNIPINSCRFALCQYAFACRLMIDSSRSDAVILKQIPSTVSSIILTKDKRILGNATYTKTKPITKSKFQYATVFDAKTDVIELKVAQNERTIYYFEEPVEVMSEQPEGVTIYSSAANYIDFISTLETVAINVYKLNYLYNNIDVINDLSNNTSNNEKDYSKLNLRGVLFDENGVGTQLTQFKIEDIKKNMRSGGIIKAKIILENEKVGDLIQIETAFDGIKTGIITSMSISFGYKDIAEIEVLEWPIG